MENQFYSTELIFTEHIEYPKKNACRPLIHLQNAVSKKLVSYKCKTGLVATGCDTGYIKGLETGDWGWE